MKKNYIESSISWLKAFAPSIAWAVVIFIFSSQTSLPGFAVSWTDYVLKKMAHIFVYAVLFLLLHWGITQTTTKNQRSNLAVWQVAFIFTFLYAISDEIHQTFIPGRYGTIRDLGYDMLGAFIAFLKRYNYI